MPRHRTGDVTWSSRLGRRRGVCTLGEGGIEPGAAAEAKDLRHLHAALEASELAADHRDEEYALRSPLSMSFTKTVTAEGLLASATGIAQRQRNLL